MRSALFSVCLSVASLTLLTACGSSKSVVTGDFTEFEGAFDGVKVELNYYSRSLQERVLLGSEVVKDGSFKLTFSYDEEVPRYAYLYLNNADDESGGTGRPIIVERGAQYAVEILDESRSLFRVTSDGTYAHIFVLPIEDELKELELENKLNEAIQLVEESGQDVSLPYDVDDSSEGTVREPSAHARVLDWQNMNCVDYAGEYEKSWDSRFFNPNPFEQSKAVIEVRDQLYEFYERVYGERVRTMLHASTDPIERLLLVGRSRFFEDEQEIEIYEELAAELPDSVVEERVQPRLTFLRERRERRQANEALKLGTIIPSIDFSLPDQNIVSLSSILQGKQVVVLEFWDNYCQRCIDALEQYRSFYSDFAGVGLEIVSLSFEDNRVDWVEKSGELDFPWINAFAPDGSDGEISDKFGLRSIKANYVLDSEGCILKRNLTPDELLDFLGARLGS
ncbi:MAG: AhpC/TSA family protein [Gammaproteobacteria bacterium]|nr:AhpC/TSA family protein [Gammaproteobacteria bacterium]